MSVKEALEGLEKQHAATMDMIREISKDLEDHDEHGCDGMAEYFKAHLSTVREWVALAQQAYDEGVKTIARLREEMEAEKKAHAKTTVEAMRLTGQVTRLTAALEEARGLVDEAISAGNYGRLGLIRAALSGKGEGAPATCPDLDVCSFCGRHKESGVKIIVGPRVTICSDCVGNAVEHLKTWPEIPPPDPVCTHCDDTRRVETECGDVICPMCRPPPNPLCEHCGISSRVGPIDHSPDCPLNPKGCKPEGES